MSEPKFKFVVRSPEGELKFESFLQIRQAYLSGLISLDDEIREADGTKWRKASSYPALVEAGKSSNPTWQSAQTGWLWLSLIVASVSLYLVVQGLRQQSYGKAGAGLLLAFGLSGLLFRVLTRPHRR